ncbi:MAG: ribosome recycling factor [Christensenellales bacterium]
MTTQKEVYDELKQNLEKVINHLNVEFSSVRAGRANPKILDKVLVDYYGSPTPLYQMANISVPEPRMLLISLWDTSMIKDVVKAINEANIGINPNDDGKVIRLVFPVLTEERRKELVKQTKKIAEDVKVSARNERRVALDNIKLLKKDNLITEDGEKLSEKEVQKILDEYIAKIDKMAQDKEKEIMEI